MREQRSGTQINIQKNPLAVHFKAFKQNPFKLIFTWNENIRPLEERVTTKTFFKN